MADSVIEFLAYELVAVFAVITVILLFQAQKNLKATRDAVASGDKNFNQDIVTREDKLKQILSDKYKLTGQALDAAVTEFVERERQIHKAVLATFVKRNEQSLTRVNQLIASTVETCLEFLPVDQAQSEDGATLDEPEADANTNASEPRSEEIELPESEPHARSVDQSGRQTDGSAGKAVQIDGAEQGVEDIETD